MRIGILTSGGDAPGMNAAIRAVVRKGIYDGHQIIGFKRGFNGLISGEMTPMNLGSVADIIHRGGTMLHTARSSKFSTPEGIEEAMNTLKGERFDGLIVIGGDGSMRGAQTIAARGIRVACIPASIDNDIPCTDMSIGFDTALNTILDGINKVRDTATSHERTFVIEVMGRERGFLALAAGIAGGAESILVPEIGVDMDDVCSRLLRGHRRGKTHSIIVVAEGAGSGFEIAQGIGEKIGFETRVTVLGHVQRGGTPSALDRALGSRMGAAAVDTLAGGSAAMMVGVEGQRMKAWELDHVLSQKKEFDMETYKLAAILAI